MLVQPKFETAKSVRRQSRVDWLSEGEEECAALNAYALEKSSSITRRMKRVRYAYHPTSRPFTYGIDVTGGDEAGVEQSRRGVWGVCGGAGLTCAGDNDWQGLDRLRVIPLGVGSILQLNSYDAHDHLRA